jgi:hypothetical protein
MKQTAVRLLALALVAPLSACDPTSSTEPASDDAGAALPAASTEAAIHICTPPDPDLCSRLVHTARPATTPAPGAIDVPVVSIRFFPTMSCPLPRAPIGTGGAEVRVSGGATPQGRDGVLDADVTDAGWRAVGPAEIDDGWIRIRLSKRVHVAGVRLTFWGEDRPERFHVRVRTASGRSVRVLRVTDNLTGYDQLPGTSLFTRSFGFRRVKTDVVRLHVDAYRAGMATDAGAQLNLYRVELFSFTDPGECYDPSVTGIPGVPSGVPGDPLAGMRAEVDDHEMRLRETLQEGSRNRGAGDPAVRYRVTDVYEWREPVPVSCEHHAGSGRPRPDYRSILDCIDICGHVEGGGTKLVWMWSYDHPSGPEPAETNMAMGELVPPEFLNHGTYGDVSNSEQSDDLPICDHTYVVVNPAYGTWVNAVHNHMHQNERALAWHDARMFFDMFVGERSCGDWVCSYGGELPAPRRCGEGHNPPNRPGDVAFVPETPCTADTDCTMLGPGLHCHDPDMERRPPATRVCAHSHYIYDDTRSVLSDCWDWAPVDCIADPADPACAGPRFAPIDCTAWGCTPEGYYRWWMQRLPGPDNRIPYEDPTLGHRCLRNWWEPIADWDAALTASPDRDRCLACAPLAPDECPAPACPAALARPANVLIYGPGGAASVEHFPPGTVTTTADEATWRAMTSDQFAAYDLIWVDGNSCEGRPPIFQALADTQAVWGAAVTGRVALNTADPDFHDQAAYIANHLTWLSSLGATASGGRTGMYFSSGCSYFSDNGPPYHDAFEPTFGSPLRSILLNGEPTAIVDAAHPLLAGYPTIDTLYWSNYCHGGIAAPYPSGFTSLVTCHGGSGLLVRDPCVTP